MVEDPNTEDRVTIVRRSDSNAGWWIAALVAVIAVAGLIFMYVNQNNQAELQAARDQGAAEATLDNATANAQMAAAQATQAAQSATERAAAAGEHAAASAQAAAQQTAQAANEAAQDASASVSDPAPAQ